MTHKRKSILRRLPAGGLFTASSSARAAVVLASTLFAIVFFVCPAAFGASGSDKRDMVLWYRQPATAWLQAMPLGNGMIGAMVFGGVPQERIALNESSFWSGRPHDYNDTNAVQYFPRIRDLVFAGKFQEAEKMANDHFYGKPKAQEAYQPIGDLLLSFDTNNVADYRRELDMETGVAKVTYRSGDAVITREAFVSWPDRVLVVHISADQPGRISFGAQFRGPYLETSVASRDRLVMDGTWKGPFSAPPTGMAGLIARTRGNGLRYQAALAARLAGGRSEAAGSTLNITNADAVTLVLAVATSFVNYNDISGDPAARCKKVLDTAAEKDFAALHSRHVADFGSLMGRVHLRLGDVSQNEKPTDERLKAVRAGGSRSEPGSPRVSIWPLSSGVQQPRRWPAGQPPRHLERGTPSTLGEQIHCQYQPSNELLARGSLQSL